MNRDLFLAIAAMDAYNQGYDAGIELTEHGIGTASFIADSRILGANGQRPDIDESFYAVAYRWNGETIISYRGTDNVVGDADDWAGGGGFQTDQAWLGAQFYRAVIANDINTPGVYDANVTFTGHSLGGGIAGLLGSVYGQPAVVFDNMAYAAAAQGTYLRSIETIPNGSDPNPFYDFQLKEIYYGAQNVQPTDSRLVHGWQVDGQVLQGAQSSGAALGQGSGLDLARSVVGLSSVQLHSISLLVLLLHAREEAGLANDADWANVALPLLKSLHDDGIAEAAGVERYGGTASPADKMRDMIAYSALDEGARPFGDAGIWALFDDAKQLDPLLAGLPADPLDTQPLNKEIVVKALRALPGIVAQFAGQLAINQVVSNPGPPNSAFNGITYAAEDSAGLALSVDSTADAWKGERTEMHVESLEDFKAALPLSLFEAGYSPVFSESAHQAASGVRYVVAATPDGNPVFADVLRTALAAADRLGEAPENVTSLMIGSVMSDKMAGTAVGDLIFAGQGNDILVGNGGQDVIAGDGGDDLIVASHLFDLGQDGIELAPLPTAPEGTVDVDSGQGADWIVLGLTGDEGVVTLQGGTAEDRLFIRGDILNMRGDGIPLFPLLGGVNYGYDGPVLDEDGDGGWEYSFENSLGPVNDEPTTILKFDAPEGEEEHDHWTALVGYEYFFADSRLEINVEGLRWGPGYENLTVRIVIDGFRPGDYGIQLVGPIDLGPRPDQPDDVPWDGELPGVPAAVIDAAKYETMKVNIASSTRARRRCCALATCAWPSQRS
jgi:hypothetical protein